MLDPSWRRRSSRYGASSASRPARCNAIAMIASDCGPSSSTGRLRCSRVPRSTWATASRPNRSTTSTSNASSTPHPSTNGSTSSVLRRAAYSPASGCTMSASFGKQQRQQRAGDELGDASSTRGRAFERTRVERLHEHRAGIVEQRPAEPFDVLAPEVAEVGVEVANDVAGARGEGLPQHVALAGPGCRPRAGSRLPATTRAPAAAATAAVSSVEPSSMTTISSTPATPRTASTIAPTVVASLRAGRHTEIRGRGVREPGASIMKGRVGEAATLFVNALIESGRGTGPLTPRQPVERAREKSGPARPGANA